MNERTKQLADNATHYANGVCDADPNADWYEVRDAKFAELVRQEEREACAKLCESIAKPEKNIYYTAPLIDIAIAAIRARGTE